MLPFKPNVESETCGIWKSEKMRHWARYFRAIEAVTATTRNERIGSKGRSRGSGGERRAAHGIMRKELEHPALTYHEVECLPPRLITRLSPQLSTPSTKHQSICSLEMIRSPGCPMSIISTVQHRLAVQTLVVVLHSLCISDRHLLADRTHARHRPFTCILIYVSNFQSRRRSNIGLRFKFQASWRRIVGNYRKQAYTQRWRKWPPQNECARALAEPPRETQGVGAG